MSSLRRLALAAGAAVLLAGALFLVCALGVRSGRLPTTPASESMKRSAAATVSMEAMMPGMLTSPTPSVEVKESSASVAGVLRGEPDLRRTLDLMRLTGVLRGLEQTAPVTVFAPTFEAFDSLTGPTYLQLLELRNAGRLAALMRRHVVPGSYPPERLLGTKRLKTTNGDDVTAEASGTQIVLDGECTITERVKASNGWVYRVDSVLSPH